MSLALHTGPCRAHCTLHFLTDLAVSVDIDALVIVAEEELHPISVGEGDDGVGGDGALGVLRQVDVVHTGGGGGEERQEEQVQQQEYEQQEYNN